MKPLYDRYAELVGWLSDDRKHIFDTYMDWVGIVSADQRIWSPQSKAWLGTLDGCNVQDTMGLIAFWNPATRLANDPNFDVFPTPLFQGRLIRPKRPLKPMRRLEIVTPPEVLILWSEHTWMTFFQY